LTYVFDKLSSHSMSFSTFIQHGSFFTPNEVRGDKASLVDSSDQDVLPALQNALVPKYLKFVPTLRNTGLTGLTGYVVFAVSKLGVEKMESRKKGIVVSLVGTGAVEGVGILVVGGIGVSAVGTGAVGGVGILAMGTRAVEGVGILAMGTWAVGGVGISLVGTGAMGGVGPSIQGIF
jgi:hypothetical protein